MAAGDDPRPGDPRADDAAGTAAGEVEEIRRSLARGGRPRVGRRFDAVMQTAKASRRESPPEWRRPRQDQLPRWEDPDEQADEEHAAGQQADDERADEHGPDQHVADEHGPDEHAGEQSGDAATNAATDAATSDAATSEAVTRRAAIRRPRRPTPTVRERGDIATAPLAPAPAPEEAGEPPAAAEARPESIVGPAPESPPDVPAPTVVETTGEGILRPDELAALRAGAPPPTPGARDRVLGIPWPPHAAVAFLVAVIALIAFGLGIAVGGLQRQASSSSSGPAQTASAPTAPPQTAAAVAPPVTVTVPVPAPPPRACLETARLGDQTIALLTANIRDRRLDESLRRYAAASQACRNAASQNP